jgi:hypothetical protein
VAEVDRGAALEQQERLVAALALRAERDAGIDVDGGAGAGEAISRRGGEAERAEGAGHGVAGGTTHEESVLPSLAIANPNTM